MLRKFAGALLAATIFVAPALAADASKNATPAAPAVAATQSVKPDVKAASTVKIKKNKHARRHVRSHIAKHGTSVKHVKAAKSLSKVSRIKTSKRIHAKLHARSHMQTAAKPVTKTGTN